MSSRVLRGDAAGRAAPMVWRETGAVRPAPPVKPGSGDSVDDLLEQGAQQWAAQSHRLELRIASLERELKEKVEQARREGHQAGYAEGQAAVGRKQEAEVHAAVDQLAGAAQQLHGLRAQLLAKEETSLVRLAVAIARRILNRELTIDPEAVLALVRVGLDKLRMQQISRLRVYPEHAAAVRLYLERLPGGCDVQVVEDPSLGRGGAVFETERGDLDVSVEAQLKEVEQGLTDRL